MKLDMCRCFHLLPDHYPIFTFLLINDPVIMLDFMNMHNNYSDKTIECREFYLHYFNQYLVQNKLSFNDMSVDVIEVYFRFMGYELLLSSLKLAAQFARTGYLFC